MLKQNNLNSLTYNNFPPRAKHEKVGEIYHRPDQHQCRQFNIHNSHFPKVPRTPFGGSLRGKISLCLLLFFSTLFANAQTKGSISGRVTDTEGIPLNSVHIVLKGTLKGVVTDANGVYLLKGVTPGEHILMASYISYKTKSKSVVVRANETLEVDFSLEEDDLNLDQVVVSASRTPEKLSEIPASITVVDYKKLKSLATNTTDMSEILALAVPGLAPNTGTFSNWGQTLRGRKLLVMVDGIPQSTPLRNGQVAIAGVQPGAIESIEVVKGPTSIYGNGADGGFINYITRTPDKSRPLSGSANLWGTINPAYTDKSLGWGVQQSLTGGLYKLSYYVSASYEKTGTMYDGKGKILSPNYGLDNTEIISALAKIGYQIADNQSINLMFNTYQTRQQTPYVPQIGKLKVTDASGNRSITPTTGMLPTADNPLKGSPQGVSTQNLHLKYTLEGIFRGSTRFGTDVYYQKNRNIFFWSPIFKGGGQSVINSRKFGVRPIFNTELTMNTPLRISFTYGLDVLRDISNQDLLDGRLWVPNLNLLSIAPFLQAKFKFKDDWVVKAGVRHDGMKLNIESFSSLPVRNRRTGGYTTSVNVTGGDLTFNNTAYNAGIRYIKHDEFVPYINYSQGFLLPDIGAIMRSATSKTNVANLKPEAVKINSYEFGFLSSFDHVRFEAVGYYSTSNLGQSLSFAEGTENILVQSKSPQKIFGAEVALDFSFFDNDLLFGGSYSYVEGLQHAANNPYNLTYIGGDLIAPSKFTAHVIVKPTDKLTTSIRYLRVGNRKRFASTKKVMAPIVIDTGKFL